jgi:hypothetical protein
VSEATCNVDPHRVIASFQNQPYLIEIIWSTGSQWSNSHIRQKQALLSKPSSQG